MKKIWTLLFMTILIFPMFSMSLMSDNNPTSQSQEDFINFLVNNKETLKYESFGTFEHEEWIEVRVYCNDETRKKIEENIAEFNYKEYNYKNSGVGTGTLFVIFNKNAVSGSDVVQKTVVKKKKKCPRKVFVEFREIGKKNFSDYKYFEKKLIDGGVSPVYSGFAGTVGEVFISAGDKVSAGDVILNFDISEIEKNLKEAKSSLADWKVTLRKRMQWKVRSPRAELQAENKVKSLEARIEELNSLKNNNTILSDKKGQIISVVSQGTVLEEGDEVGKILDNTIMKMIFSGDDASLLSGLNEISVKFEGIDKLRDGKVEKIGDKVTVSFENGDLKLSSKSVGRFKVLLKTYNDAVVLKESEIKKDNEGNFVYIVNKKRAKKVYIKTGPAESGEIVVLSGLNEGDEFITTDDDCIYDGKKIKFTPPAKKKQKIEKKKIVKKKKEKKQKAKYVKKEEKPVDTDKVRFIEKKDWSDFDNCPSTLKVKTKVVGKTDFIGYETFDSFVISGDFKSIQSDFSGIVSDVYVSTGETVSSGKLLLDIDTENISKRLENAKNSLSEWKRLLSEIEKWTERSINLENELKEKIRKISILIPKYNNAITNSKIYSPVDGTVNFIVRKGDAFNEHDLLVKIEDSSSVRVSVNVKDASKYSENMKVEVGFKGVEGTFPATLRIEDGKVVAVVDNHSKSLVPGIKAKVNIQREFNDVISLYKSEFLRDSDGYFCYIVKGKRAARIDLITGADNGNQMLILSGLNIGDELITSGFDCLEDGKKIKIKYFDPNIGKYVIKRTKEEKKSIEGRLFEKKVAAGLGLGLYTVSDDVFKGVYGSAVLSGVLDLSFNVFNRVELFTNIMYIPKSGSSESITKVDLSMFSFYIGGKYLINWTGKFLPYIGVALNSLAVKETSDELNLDTSYRTSVGFSGIGGFYYKLKDNINIKFDLRYDVNKMKIEEYDYELDFSGIKFVLGVVFRF